MLEGAEVMRYHSASAGDLSGLRIRVFAKRFEEFKRIHERHIKFEVQLAGGKPH